MNRHPQKTPGDSEVPGHFECVYQSRHALSVVLLRLLAPAQTTAQGTVTRVSAWWELGLPPRPMTQSTPGTGKLMKFKLTFQHTVKLIAKL